MYVPSQNMSIAPLPKRLSTQEALEESVCPRMIGLAMDGSCDPPGNHLYLLLNKIPGCSQSLPICSVRP
eukprot:SAG11_NODE_1486_length_4819_cov_1.894280_3_plen_69_part_00